MRQAQEARRKLIHMLGGLGPPISIYLFGWVGSVAILLFLLTYIVLGGLLNLRGVRLPVIADLIENTQRETERFPTTAVEFLASILVLGTLLHEPWFFPAIGILAFGDGFAGLFGTLFGRHRLPWNRRKSWEGLAAGLVGGAGAAALLTLWGVSIHDGGHEFDPMLGAHWLAPAVFIVAAFITIVGGTGFYTRRRVSGKPVASRRYTLMAAALGLLAAAGPLTASTLGLIENGPLLSYQVIPNAAQAGFLVYVSIATIAVMVLETVLRRHDNLILPTAFVAAMLALATWDPFAFGLDA